MGEPDVDEIIGQWRASARAAGAASDDREDESRGRWDRVPLARGRSVARVAAVLVAVAALTFVAVGVVSGGSGADDPGRAAAGPPGGGSPAPGETTILNPMAEPASSAAAEGAGGQTSPSDAVPPVADWFGIVSAVDGVREAAYRSADPSGLSEAFAADSPALERELEVVEALKGSGVTARGWTNDLLAVSPTDVGPEHATVRVRDRRGGYDLVDLAGGSTRVAAADPAAWVMDFAQSDGRWLVIDVRPEVTSPTGLP